MTPGFVSSLLRGELNPDVLTPFPRLPEGRARQLESVLADIRSAAPSEASGIDSLRSWGLLQLINDWPPLVLGRVLREVGGIDLSAALCAIAHLALGARLVRAFGTERQLRESVERPGGAVFAFGLTEASPGSDVSQLTTFAEPDGSDYLLTGTKHWVTNACAATHIIVLARTVPPHPGAKPKMTAFLVPVEAGVVVTRVPSSVLPGALVGQVSFDQLRVPGSAVLGEPGKGFRVVMQGLSEARLLVAAAIVGSCVRSFDETIQRLSARRAFGRRVGHFPSVQDRVSSMLCDILALESLVCAAAGVVHSVRGIDPVERAVVRLAASRTSSRVLDAARELHGAAAFAGDTEAARRWTDARALTLLDGSDLALESFIILEGTRELRHRRDPKGAARNLLAPLHDFSSRAKKELEGKLRRLAYGGPASIRLDRLGEHAIQLAGSVKLELARHGEELVEMQHVQRRLATILTELSTWFALAMRVDAEVRRHGPTGSQRMIEAAEIWISAADARIQVHFAGLAENDDPERDRIASRAYADLAYPFDIF